MPRITHLKNKKYIYYIKVSGILCGNKLKKKRYDILTYEDMISSHVKISMISLASSLSLKLYLNSLVYYRNIFGSSSKVFGSLRKSSDIFGNFQKFSENVRERSSGLRDNFGKFWKIFGKLSEIFGKSSKTPSSVRLYNKKSITRELEDMNFMFISSRHRVIKKIIFYII